MWTTKHQRNTKKNQSTWLNCFLCSVDLIQNGGTSNLKWWKQLTKWCTEWICSLVDSRCRPSKFRPWCKTSARTRMAQQKSIRQTIQTELPVKSPILKKNTKNPPNLDWWINILLLKTTKRKPLQVNMLLTTNYLRFRLLNKRKLPFRPRQTIIRSFKNAHVRNLRWTKLTLADTVLN